MKNLDKEIEKILGLKGHGFDSQKQIDRFYALESLFKSKFLELVGEDEKEGALNDWSNHELSKIARNQLRKDLKERLEKE